MSYVNILLAFLVRCKISSLFFRLSKIDQISHYFPLSRQILNNINIFDINRKLLAHAFTLILHSLCLVTDKCTRELEVGTLTLNFAYFHTFTVHSKNTFLSIFVYNKYLVLILTCSRIIVDLK